MSRGLGPLQREILAALDAGLSAPGGRAGRAFLGADSVELAEGVIDLQPVKRRLAEAHGELRPYRRFRPAICSGFEVRFSRAVSALIRRGELERLALVPVSAYRAAQERSRILCLPDGAFLQASRTHNRFVRRRGLPKG